MSVIVVLAMHGSPPTDFPRRELGEFFSLHMQLEHGVVAEERRPILGSRYTELEEKMCSWPRTEQNDPFYAASHKIATKLSQATGYEVIVGFNEFCAPNLYDALSQAVRRGATEIVVITPMMTPGGEHAEIDIPAAISRAQKRYPEVDFRYAWPFDTDAVAQFLSTQVARHV